MFVYELFEKKIKGADGKACWKGYRYAGTEDGKDRCVPVNKLKESSASEAVQSAILNRIMRQHPDVLGQYGPDTCMRAAEEVASYVGDVEEIGSSDVSAWTKQTIDLCREYGRS